MIDGLGHGTPIGDGLGTPGSFMLDTGISSTREIPRFWSIDATRTDSSMRSNLKTAASEKPSSRSPWPVPEKATAKLPTPWNETPRPRSDPHGVQTVIEDALRVAGLMR